MVTKGERGVGRDKLGVGIKDNVFLCIKQITSKDLLYSTGNSIPYLVIPYKGKESERNWCMYN